jgi:hypothetical protein
VRMCISAGFKRERNPTLSVLQVHHRVYPRLAAASPECLEQQRRRSLEAAADPPAIRARLRDVLRTVVSRIARRLAASGSAAVRLGLVTCLATLGPLESRRNRSACGKSLIDPVRWELRP